jgi:predicted TIM-barrel fold metal-dependent hydrolase
MEKFYDSHCHVFTQKETVNLRLIIQIIFALPDILEKEKTRKVSAVEDLKKKKNQLKRIINFIKVGLSDSEQTILDKMEEVYKNQFCIAPLMFDLECVFISSRSGEENTPEIDMSTLLNRFDNTVADFHDHHEKNIERSKILLGSLNIAEVTRDIEEYERMLIESKKLFAILKSKNLEKETFPQILMKNYELQLEDITQLKNDNPDTVYPFIAIDPRRKGIIERYIHDIYPQNIFTGVKLYCPNGYSPTDDELMKPGGLYEFCERNNIPITAHHSHGGFATPLEEVEISGDIYIDGKVTPAHRYVKFSKAFSDGWVADRAEKLNHPDLWDKVLTNFPKLKLNLAHFGNGSAEWQEKLKDMLANYDNFHTDLSCWTDRTELNNFKNNIFIEMSEEVKAKVLYGSDYYLDLLFIDSFQEYVDNFYSIFTPEEFTQIALTNAKKFLLG